MQYLACDGILTITGTTPDLTCSGSWIALDTALIFDPSSLDASIVVSAIGNGFIVAGVPLIIIMCCRIILETIKGKRL
jgi:hypothetical protein